MPCHAWKQQALLLAEGSRGDHRGLQRWLKLAYLCCIARTFYSPPRTFPEPLPEPDWPALTGEPGHPLPPGHAMQVPDRAVELPRQSLTREREWRHRQQKCGSLRTTIQM